MKKQSVSALVFVATLAACTSTDPVYTQFYREAGSTVDNGSFGTATNNNIQGMNGERQYTVDLANRFATEITSMVTFAFNSSQLDANAQTGSGSSPKSASAFTGTLMPSVRRPITAVWVWHVQIRSCAI